MPALIGSRDDAFGCGDPIELAPGIARLDPVDAMPPRIVRNVKRWRCLRRFAQRQNIRGGAMTEPSEAGLDLGEHVRGQSPAQVRAEKRVVVVLVTEPGRILIELSHKSSTQF